MILWDYNPIAIKLAPYYNDLLKWCDSVDLIRESPYNGDPVKYPSNHMDSNPAEDTYDILVDELLYHNVLTSSPTVTTDFIKKSNDLGNSKLPNMTTGCEKIVERE